MKQLSSNYSPFQKKVDELILGVVESKVSAATISGEANLGNTPETLDDLKSQIYFDMASDLLEYAESLRN